MTGQGPWGPRQYDPRQHQQRLGQPPQEPYPPQGQPWQQQGYQAPQGPPGWQQPGYGQQPPWGPQYAPGPQQPPRRQRHVARYVLAAIGGLIVVIIAVVVANSSGHTVQTAGSAATGSGNAGDGKASGSAPKTAGIGSAINLSGNASGEQMSVTVTKVITDAQPGDEFSAAPAGDRLYAVQFRLRDTGSAAYSDAPSNGAAVVDSSGQSYQSALDNAASCQSFPGSENIAPGASGLGCIVFEVPQSAKITGVQFTLDSGMGPQTGQWNVG
jgi:hypothetical protein